METIALRPLEQPRRKALAAWAGLAAAALVVVVPTVDGALRPGYRPSQHWISHLALGPGGWVVRTVLIIAGVLMAAATVGLRRSLPGRAGTWTVGALLTCGAGLVAGGIFPIDPGLGYPPGAVPAQTWHGSVHDLSGLAVFGGLAVAGVAGAVALRGRARGRSWYSAVSGVVVAVSFVATSALAAMAYSGAWPEAPSGLTERMALYPAMVWFAWLCLRSARANP